MADTLYFTRDTKCYIEFSDTVWEIPVLDGFGFSQATNSTEITINEAETTGGVSKRGRRAFNDSLAPGEWSISIYARPFVSAGSGTGAADSATEVHAVEEVLWAMMAGASAYSSSAFTDVTTPASSTSVIDFSESNKGSLSTFNMYFVVGDHGTSSAVRKVYKLASCTVNEASVDFDIDGITTINWTGNATTVSDFTGSTIEKATTPDGASDNNNDGDSVADGDVWLDSDDGYRLYVMTSASAATAVVYEGVSSTTNLIRNRLTSMTVSAHTDHTGQSALQGASAGASGGYVLTITGGNVTFSNNITYLTPETLGQVNSPIAHITSTRAVSGNFTCYLTDSANATDSQSFYADLASITSVVTNKFKITMNVGGTTAPFLKFIMPQCHVEIPTHDVGDLISLNTEFMALPSTIDATDEATITYGAS